MQKTKKSLELISPNNLQSNEKFLAEVKYEMFDDWKVNLYKKNYCFVILTESNNLFTGNKSYDQTEFPLKAIPWFIDTIENKFWKHTPNPKSLPGEVKETAIIDEEKIGINPMRHCCGENIFGYSLWNSSKKNNITDFSPQEWQIPRYMLEEGLMDQLKKISTDLGLKTYS